MAALHHPEALPCPAPDEGFFSSSLDRLYEHDSLYTYQWQCPTQHHHQRDSPRNNAREELAHLQTEPHERNVQKGSPVLWPVQPYNATNL